MEQNISHLSKIITPALISNILEAVLLISRILVCITSSFTFAFFAFRNKEKKKKKAKNPKQAESSNRCQSVTNKFNINCVLGLQVKRQV